MAPIAAFKKYDRNGLNVRFEIVSIEKLSKEVFDWCFNLVKGNMQNWFVVSFLGISPVKTDPGRAGPNLAFID